MQKTNTTRIFHKIVTPALAILALVASSKLLADPLLNGVAAHGELGKEQFIAGLYTSTLSNSANSILTNQEDKRLQVRVLASQLSSRRFRRMWIEGMAINSSPAELEKHARNMAAFSNMLKIKLINGDIFTVNRTSDLVTVSLNGTTLGEIDDPEFFDLLIRTWIGPVPLSTEFRKDLLSDGEIKPGPLARFEATGPDEQRIAAIEQAIAAKNAGGSGAGATIASAAGAAAQVAAPAVAAPKPKIDLPDSSSDDKAPAKVDIAPPKVKVVEKPKPTPKPKPKQIALAPQEEELDDSIFDDDDGEEFTAESLLKEQLYYSQLAKYTHRYLKYPQRAWDRGREGNVRLRVTIDRDGNLEDTEILDAAQYKSLNKEAQKAVKRAQPYPAVPDEISGDTYSFTFRVAFKIVER